jgi:hypothetical protein
MDNQRQYRLVIPLCDNGNEAVVTGGEVMLEIADLIETKLVRNQRRVSVETLVRALFPDDTLNKLREMDGMVPPEFLVVHHRN